MSQHLWAEIIFNQHPVAVSGDHWPFSLRVLPRKFCQSGSGRESPPQAQSVGALRCLHILSQAYSESRLPAEMIPIKLKGFPKGLPV